MNQRLRPILMFGLLLLLSLGLSACEKERPPETPSSAATVAPARGTVAPSPTPPVVLTQISIPAASSAQTPEGATAAGATTPTPPAPESVVVNPPSQGGQSGSESEQFFVYTVASGDTLAAIAARFGVSQEAIVRLNGLADPNALALGQQLKIPGTQPASTEGSSTTGTPGETSTYVVQAGDTMAAIARRFGTTVAELAQLNNITNPDRISVGQKLIVPSSAGSAGQGSAGQGRTYVIQQGDTLLSIARRFGITVQQLQAANNIADPDRIYPGQVLTIP